MRCELMHCDTVVGTVLFNETTGVPTDFLELMDADHMPFGTVVEGTTGQVHLMAWWAKRPVPTTRPGISEALAVLDAEDPQALAVRSMGLSLSDSYWIRPEGSDLSWEDVNLYDNPFSEYVGDAIVGGEVSGEPDWHTPDPTTEGNERKRWKVMDGHPHLLKSGFGPYGQEPYCEVAATALYDATGIPHVRYSVRIDGGRACSCCQMFTGRGLELVTAHQALLSMGKGIGTDYLGAFLRICGDHGLDVRWFLEDMLTMDFVMANTDRHMRNFGILRDPETLEWKGMAPVFDNGGSFGFDVPTESLRSESITKARPFAETFAEQMELVGFSQNVDTGRLRRTIPDMCRVFDGWGAEPERVDAISRLVEDRLGIIESADRVG